MLLRKKLIGGEQHKNILLKGEGQRKRLQQFQESAYSRRYHQVQDYVSPAEVIASFDIEIPGTNGKILTEDVITEHIAAEVGMKYIKIDPLKLNLDVVTKYVPRPFALKHLIVAVDEKDGAVVMAVVDPYGLDAVESIKTARRINVELVLASKSDVLKIVREFFGFKASISAAQAEMTPSMELGNLEQYVRLKGQKEIEANDQHIINAVEYLLHYAFDQRASDIHIEPKREKSIVRLRIDGVLHYIHSMPRSVHPPVVSRLKMLARMDIADKRRPQDGRIKSVYNDKELELRVSTLPVAFGEKIVIRIFDPDILMQELEDIGFDPREFRIYDSFLKRPNGILLVTGPTGSGKTTTLYSSLKVLSTPEVNIVTIEEPIEMVMEEFNQVGVQNAIDVTFSNILKTILRQDPDIIMVGEIRDRETAENAIQAALTGHLVLSTLHTNDAPSSITRLLDLGVPSFLISSTLIGVVAQRLVRKICPHCKKERLLTEDEHDSLQIYDRPCKVYSGEGCSECRGTGYKGRTGIFEILEFTDSVRSVLSDKVDLAEIFKTAREQGMVSLRQSAIRKMLDGVTTYEEVIAVT
jgi:general secretion pathway protein E